MIVHSSTAQKTPPEEADALHIRLCHHCSHVNENAEPVGQCDRCGKHLSFYSLLEDLTEDSAEETWLDEWDSEEEDNALASASLAEMEEEPILQGLTVRW